MKTTEHEYFVTFEDGYTYRIEVQKTCTQLRIETYEKNEDFGEEIVDSIFVNMNRDEVIGLRDALNKVVKDQ